MAEEAWLGGARGWRVPRGPQRLPAGGSGRGLGVVAIIVSVSLEGIVCSWASCDIKYLFLLLSYNIVPVKQKTEESNVGSCLVSFSAVPLKLSLHRTLGTERTFI